MNAGTVIQAVQEEVSKAPVVLTAHGISMLPLIGAGQKFVVERTSWEELSVGDVVLYRSADTMTLHRIARVVSARKEIICRGDNARSYDAPIPYSSVIGKARLQTPSIAAKIHFVFWDSLARTKCLLRNLRRQVFTRHP